MRLQFFILLWSAPLLFGNDFLTVDQIIPGQKVLGITLHDSIETPDLSQISVEGYEVENAVFVQDNDPLLPVLLNEYVIDVTAFPDFQVVDFQPELQTLIVRSPVGHTWMPGQIVCDTSYQGISQKIVQVEETFSDYSTIIWRLKTVPATLLEMVNNRAPATRGANREIPLRAKPDMGGQNPSSSAPDGGMQTPGWSLGPTPGFIISEPGLDEQDNVDLGLGAVVPP